MPLSGQHTRRCSEHQLSGEGDQGAGQEAAGRGQAEAHGDLGAQLKPQMQLSWGHS